ncbi:MAG: glycosyltransferase family 2 protein [Rhodothermaceae bacterium]|nr:glycosyltransferase family 2 protein [Bacteroidota bacterium]MXW14681.1 glycosyltransferase family 2 protein [Rhodothermaceae bacterium]MDE2645503.1 glycosyltransferase family 2 protein [Bacteroidota bacterium]MXW31719.1 glycosyltransferase family 2 protein [Rhodothermaceae bacterium]MXX97724.1 glycosyltransferase family 2 protein [Rhodothermaceae bacterium]
METPHVAVIIVSYNGLPIVQQCLPTVAQTKWENLQIVFVDNHSSDDSVGWVREHFPNIQILSNPDNWLFSRANNEAIRQTECDYVALLNNDVAVSDDWLEPLVKRAESSSRIAVLQPKILQFHRRSHFEYAGASGGFLDQLGYPLARGRIFEHTEEDVGQYDTSIGIDWASGAAMLLRRSALDDVGLLDEFFELHMEEIDLCWRLRRAGYKIEVVPESKVFHIGGATLSRTSHRKLYYNIRNNILMLYKNLPPVQFRAVFFQRVILDYSIGLAWLLTGKWRQSLAVLRGYLDAHKMKHHYSPPINAAALPSYRGRILLDYLLLRHRHFSDLPIKRLKNTPSSGNIQ